MSGFSICIPTCSMEAIKRILVNLIYIFYHDKFWIFGAHFIKPLNETSIKVQLLMNLSHFKFTSVIQLQRLCRCPESFFKFFIFFDALLYLVAKSSQSFFSSLDLSQRKDVPQVLFLIEGQAPLMCVWILFHLSNVLDRHLVFVENFWFILISSIEAALVSWWFVSERLRM